MSILDDLTLIGRRRRRHHRRCRCRSEKKKKQEDVIKSEIRKSRLI